jgi:16S rRNA (cytidine1402-2'-O)-methyltransferase
VALVASDGPSIQALLAHHGIAAPCVAISDRTPPAAICQILETLERGDVAALVEGTSVGGTRPLCAVIASVLECGFPVEPVPGPSLPLTALIVSGLPAESFAYLGFLPDRFPARQQLLAAAAAESRTLVALGSPRCLPDLLSELQSLLGDRRLAIVASDQRSENTWRGTIGEALARLPRLPGADPCVLVISGSREKPAPWNEDHLMVEIQCRLSQGLGAKETSRSLAAESGWPRREIYRLAVGTDRFHDEE